MTGEKSPNLGIIEIQPMNYLMVSVSCPVCKRGRTIPVTKDCPPFKVHCFGCEAIINVDIKEWTVTVEWTAS